MRLAVLGFFAIFCHQANANPSKASSSDPGFTSGFRLASDPKIETVFGDAMSFKTDVDRFFVLHGDMQRAHQEFAKNLQAVLLSMTAHDGVGQAGKCPVDAIALAYARAFKHGQAFHNHGKELEGLYSSIRTLDELGETEGLTPDYRWKVSRVLKLYEQVLTDFREMKVAFQNQLAGELTAKGCDLQVLVAKGDELDKAGAPPATLNHVRASAPIAKTKRGKKEPEPEPAVLASNAVFFVDNSSCKDSVRVYLDSTLLGEVGSSAKAAFHTLVGHHDMCLISASSSKQCGEPGTLRKAYVHDGWSITLRCE